MNISNECPIVTHKRKTPGLPWSRLQSRTLPSSEQNTSPGAPRPAKIIGDWLSVALSLALGSQGKSETIDWASHFQQNAYSRAVFSSWLTAGEQEEALLSWIQGSELFVPL